MHDHIEAHLLGRIQVLGDKLERLSVYKMQRAESRTTPQAVIDEAQRMHALGQAQAYQEILDWYRRQVVGVDGMNA